VHFPIFVVILMRLYKSPTAKTIILPNTLGHIGVQAPLSRLLFKKAELQWITIGCLIPDLPWITRRLLLHLQIIDPYVIDHYTIIQSSLFFSTIAAAAFSLFSRNPARVFLLLLFNCTLHLLLDACQVKWGNGVLFFAPLSWHLTQFNLFWPENQLSYFITGLGLLYFLFLWPKAIKKGAQLSRLTMMRIGILFVTLLFYLAAPFLFFSQTAAENNKYITTLINKEERFGKTIEFDRVPYNSSKKSMKTFAQETILLSGLLPNESSLLSIKGKFVTINKIEVTDVHIHSHFRDWASTIGLLLVFFLWIQTTYKQHNRNYLIK